MRSEKVCNFFFFKVAELFVTLLQMEVELSIWDQQVAVTAPHRGAKWQGALTLILQIYTYF